MPSHNDSRFGGGTLSQRERAALGSGRRPRRIKAPGEGRAKPFVSCQMSCCAMSNVLGAITEPPNGNLVNGPFGNLVVETTHFTSHNKPFDISHLAPFPVSNQD